MDIAVRCRGRGRVQGVFFRVSTRRLALSLGLRGHALNLGDGSVEIVACGDDRAVGVLKQWLQDGPDMARVDELVCEPVAADCPAGFRVG